MSSKDAAPAAHRIDLTRLNHDDALDREWLLTNGGGSYAMGTALGANTRRYHGLLVGALHPPVGRRILLSQTFEQLVPADAPEHAGPDQALAELTTCLFTGDDGARLLAPRGADHLETFEKDLTVRWCYRIGAIAVERELILHDQDAAITVRYRISGLDQPAILRVAPMLTLRDFHSSAPRDDNAFDVSIQDDRVTIRRHDAVVTFAAADAEAGAATEAVTGAQRWWHGVHYPIETRRGLEDHEDYFAPFRFAFSLNPTSAKDELTVGFTAAMSDAAAAPAPSAPPSRRERLSHAANRLSPRLPETAQTDPARLAWLFAQAADDFIVRRRVRGTELSTILAGYPWFADWGRDTFIALPGLMLDTGRHDEARDTLRAFAGAMREGLIPNRFDDYSEEDAHYNTVDASLWFVHAAMAYLDATNDHAGWKDWLADACVNVMQAYIRGTLNSIGMTGDGLIQAGDPDSQLTWMDAKCGNTVFTPRWGKAVEINALWHHALTGLATRLKPVDQATATHFGKLAGRARRAFLSVFWNEQDQCLFDHVIPTEDGEGQADASCRPNQILAASLEGSPIPRTRQVAVLKAVRDRLLTPYGLRTLPVDDPHYHGRYMGDMFQRDQSYHQGIVWPWLIGPYAEAVLRVGRFSAEARSEAIQAVTPLVSFMLDRGVGQLYEIHDADEPHEPRGCIAQAWSVAQVLHVLTLAKAPA